MSYKTGLVLAVGCLIAAAPARAGDAKGNFTVWGAGRQSCKEFAANIGREAESAWIGGYLSAYNRLTPNTNNIVPHDENVSSASLWVGNYCKQHPDSMLASALAVYTQEMTPRRIIEGPDGK